MKYIQLTDKEYNWIQEVIDDALKACENDDTAYAFKAGYLKGAILTIQKILDEIPQE